MSIRPIPTSELAAHFPGLRVLAGDYVNLEFDFEFGTAEGAVLAFAEQESELVGDAVEGITWLCRQYPDESARSAALDQLGWGYGGRPGRLDAFLAWTLQALDPDRASAVP